MIFVGFLLISLAFDTSAIFCLDSGGNEEMLGTNAKVLWIRSTPLQTLDLRGKDVALDSAEDVKVYTTTVNGNDERVYELENQLHQVMQKVHELERPPPKKRWFGCCRKKRTRSLYPTFVPPPPVRPLPRAPPVVVRVQSRPTKVLNNITNTNTNSCPPITNTNTNSHPPSSNVNTNTCPPVTVTKVDTTTSNSVADNKATTNSAADNKATTNSASENKASAQSAPPPSKEPDTPSKQEESSPPPTPVSSSESLISVPESDTPPAPPPKENGKSKVDAAEPIEHSEEHHAPSEVDEQEWKEALEQDDEEENGQKCSVSIMADIQAGNGEGETEKLSYPIYTDPKYMRSYESSSPKGNLSLRVAIANKNKSPPARPKYPIYTSYVPKSVKAKKKNGQDDDGLVRKVQLSKERKNGFKPKPEPEEDDLIRKVYIPNRKGSSSESTLSEAQSEDSPPSKKRAKGRVAIVANFWPDEESEEDVYSKYQYKRPGHPQIEPVGFAARQTSSSKKIKWKRPSQQYKPAIKQLPKKSLKKRNLKARRKTIAKKAVLSKKGRV